MVKRLLLAGNQNNDIYFKGIIIVIFIQTSEAGKAERASGVPAEPGPLALARPGRGHRPRPAQERGLPLLLYSFRTCLVQRFGNTGTDIGRAAGRDLAVAIDPVQLKKQVHPANATHTRQSPSEYDIYKTVTKRI